MKRRDFCILSTKFVGLSSLFFLSGCTPFSETSENNHYESNELAKKGKEAMFYEKLSNNAARCKICFRNCTIEEGDRGFCRNRENSQGTLYNIVYGLPSAIQIDPVEKEPQHHFHPGTQIFCVGTAGCNFRCKFCHNWQLSQKSIEEVTTRSMSPEKVVAEALDHRVSAISFTYNEPTTLYEYMYDTAKLAKEKDLGVIFHTNGSMNQEPLEQLLNYVDSATVDLKGYEDAFYQEISQAELSPVLKTLKTIVDQGVWLEIVNLMVTDLNDDPGTVRDMCKWIKDELGSEVPLHFTRFHPSYKMSDSSPTPVNRIENALEIAKEEGVQFVTIGNVPGHKYNSTFCPSCGEVLIKRHHFTINENNLDDGQCKYCGKKIPGRWGSV